MPTDHFAHKASSYEQNQDRVDNVAQIAHAMLATIPFTKAMKLMDFGSGTGLLLERIAPHVAKITAVDVSPAMQAQLRQKVAQLPCAVELIERDLETSVLGDTFDGIISSMALHHVRDIPALFKKFFMMLRPGGFIALADLEREDGSFHAETTGVHHPGFESAALARVAEQAGFGAVAVRGASQIHKHGRDYGVFLLSAQRPR